MKKNLLIITSLLCASALSLAACGNTSTDTPADAGNTAGTVTGDTQASTDPASNTDPADTDPADTENTSSDDAVKITATYELKPNTPLEAGNDQITYYEEYSDEYENDGKAFIKYNDQVFELGETQWINDSYVAAMTDGTYYIFATYQYDNDYRSTVLAQISDNQLTKSETVEGCVSSAELIKDDTVVIESRMDVFGTYGVTNEYTYRDGAIKPCDQVYDIVNEVKDADGKWLESIDADDNWGLKIYDEYGKFILTVKTAFEATGADNSAITLPVDAVIYPAQIDVENNIFYFEYNGEQCSLKYGDDYTTNRTVNGVAEDELFYVLPYAG